MVNGIPLFKVAFSERLIHRDSEADKLFGYCIEANRGPVAVPTYVASNAEAKRKFGVNFAPHFAQQGSGLWLYRVEFKESAKASITYDICTEDYAASINDTAKNHINMLKITALYPGTAPYKVNIHTSLSLDNAYTLTVTIPDVGSKKYQNIGSLTDIVNKINSKFGDYLEAKLLYDEDILLGRKAINQDGDKLVAGKTLVYDENSTNPYVLKKDNSITSSDVVLAKGPYKASRLFNNKDASGNIIDNLANGSNGKLLTTKGNISTKTIPDTGIVNQIASTDVGTNDDDANIDKTLYIAYKNAFKAMENVNLLGIATLSNHSVVQNELCRHIDGMIDPEVAKYRFGITGYLEYPEKDSNGVMNVNKKDTVTVYDIQQVAHDIDNPFIMCIGQGVKFNEEGKEYNLLPHECVQLYTGLRSALDYNQSIFGGNPKKVLNGVVDVLPINTDNTELYTEDRENLNQSGVITFLKKYDEVRFLQGVTTAQDSPVLSHESIMSIVLHVLRRLVEVAWPFMGETLTEDIKTGFGQAITGELKRITDTDNSLMPLEEYGIPPYDVEIRATTMAGFNNEGELIRETKLVAIIKIVPRGSIEAIELSVIII